LIRAFAKIAGRFPDVDLLLAGEGPLKHDLESLAATLKVTDRVRFLGVRRDVPALLKATTVFALTSVSEGASLTVLEAMAAARPIVLTDVGGNPELVRQGVDGVLAPRGDVDGIAQAFASLLSDSALAGRLGESASQRVRREFLLDRTIERYYELYRALAPSPQ
jgi:glycosyltransferase involved in cell wall biosynthesis